MGIITKKLWKINSLKQSFPSFVGPKILSDKFKRFILVDIAERVSVLGSYLVSLCLGQGTIPKS